MPSVEIVLAEFSPSRGNAGDAALPVDRLEPSLSSFRKYFPEATVTVWTDQPWESRDGVKVMHAYDAPFDRQHPRYPWRCNDYFEAYGVLKSDADVAIAVDSDLLCVSDRIRDMIPMALKFGLLMGVNGRHLVWRDARSDCDGGRVTDESRGSAMCHCTALWVRGKSEFGHEIKLLQAYLDQIVLDANCNSGARGPLSLWRAQWNTGIFPYTLPSHYCVTGSNLWVDPAHAIVLHLGHDSVRAKYADLIKGTA